jgi:hypothetical protein
LKPTRLRLLRQRCALALAALLGGIALVAVAQSAPDTPLPVVRTWTMTAADLATVTSPPPHYRVRLMAATLRGARWRPEAILDAIRGAAAILGQCGLQVETVELREFDGPREYRDLRTAVSREYAQRAGLRKPALFFVDDTRQQPAFDAEAIGRGNAATRPEMADTVWITAGARDLPLVLAHELVHVLTDSGAHAAAPGNLMREDTAATNTILTAAQCSALQQAGMTHGLVERVPTDAGDRP